MKKYIYLLAIIAVFAACKKPKDPEPVKEDPQVEPEKPAVQLKQLIARDIQNGDLLDMFILFGYNSDGFVETVYIEEKNKTGKLKYKTFNSITYESKTKLSGSNCTKIIYDVDASKNDTVWITKFIVYNNDVVTIKKVTKTTHHVMDGPTITYEDKEKDFLYIELNNKNRMTKLWVNGGSYQGFEYDELGNYFKTSILSGKNPVYYLSHKYDNNKNPLKEVIPFGFFDRVVETSLNPTIFLSYNNPTNINMSDTNPNGFQYVYDYNTEGYPIKRYAGSGNTDLVTLEYIY